MSLCLRTAGLLAVLLFATAGVSPAATPKEIDAAIKKGTDSIKMRYGGKGGFGGGGGSETHGIGPTCLSGLALLEAGVPVTDPALKDIIARVRDAAYSETKTYRVSLCVMFLDRLGEPADVPLIQALAVRLMFGQSSRGGWTYECIGPVPAADLQRLRAMKPGPAGKLHPEVEQYAQSLAAGGNQPGAGVVRGGVDDNSNTQFAVLAIWIARKHGVPVEDALMRIEQRFLATQNPQTGGWSYNSTIPNAGGAGMASPSMYCAGLIGLATAVARREERLAKSEAKKENPKPKQGSEPKKGSDDPFFNPPAKSSEPKKNPPKRPPDNLDRAVQFAFFGLGKHVAESARTGHGALVIQNRGSLGDHDLYFFWSLERAGVIFGADKIGDVDWYEAGAHTLVHAQSPDGSWGATGGGMGLKSRPHSPSCSSASRTLPATCRVKSRRKSPPNCAGQGPGATAPQTGGPQVSAIRQLARLVPLAPRCPV